MCGIAGKLALQSGPDLGELVRAMCDQIAHRGPDDWGIYAEGPVALGNRRLSIIDVAGGHQPICNEDETVWIVFNGEIYNYPELRERLESKGHRFKTHSDTETIVHLYEDHGADCVTHLNGMFAFALWDVARQRLVLARDRLGKKPLVYAATPDGITFASEIAAVLADPAVPREVDLEALDLYLSLQFVPSPWTMLRAIRKLPPAHTLVWEAGREGVGGGRPVLRRYWDVDFTPRWRGSEDEAVDAIRELLVDSVRHRLMSEVPLGAFLSGGIDSSTVVAIMARLSDRPVKTFSIGFDGDAYGELPYARSVAQRYGTEHRELDVKPQMVDVLPKLIRHFGEPFGDGSAVPTYYVSRLAAESVKVVLTGDGGDEVFAGYPWYIESFRPERLAAAFWRNGVREAQASIAAGRPRGVLGAIKGTAVGWQDTWKVARSPIKAWRRTVTTFEDSFRTGLYTPELRRALAGPRPDPIGTWVAAARDGNDPLNLLLYTDHHLYLPDDILVKADITTMAASLEARAPFLDYRVVELLASMPARWKVKGGRAKHLLRRAVADWVPAGTLNRPKVGFGLPVQRWMREDLAEMAKDLLLDEAAHYRVFLNGDAVARILGQHLEGTREYGYHLWLLLFFELWCREYLSQPAARVGMP